MLHCGLSPVEVVRDDTTCLDFHLGDESISVLHIFGMLLALSVSQPDGTSLTTHHVFGENVGRALFYWRWHTHTHVRTHARSHAQTHARTHAHSQHQHKENCYACCMHDCRFQRSHCYTRHSVDINKSSSARNIKYL